MKPDSPRPSSGAAPTVPGPAPLGFIPRAASVRNNHGRRRAAPPHRLGSLVHTSALADDGSANAVVLLSGCLSRSSPHAPGSSAVRRHLWAEAVTRGVI
jgi:hypothetical protein